MANTDAGSALFDLPRGEDETKSKTPCQFDWSDLETLFCPVHKHFVITVATGHEQNLRRLLKLGLLTEEGSAWLEAIQLGSVEP